MRDDLRFAIRGLRRRPAYSALIVLTLAAGLGVNTVLASGIDALLLRPFRIPNATRIGWIFADGGVADTTLPVFEALGRSPALTRVAAEGRLSLALTIDGQVDQAFALAVSPDYFSIVQATPLVGRVLGPSDVAGTFVPVVVSERFWQRRLDGAADPASRPFRLNGLEAAVVGVLPDDFQGPGGLYAPDVWIPLGARRALGLPAIYDAPDSPWLTIVAEPESGLSADAVDAAVTPLVTAALPPRPDRPTARVRYVRMADGHPETQGLLRQAAVAALGAVLLVLLVACFNVAGLMLARASERQSEFAVRAALGAGRGRLVRTVLLESLLLAAVAGAAALVVARWSASLLGLFAIPISEPQRVHFALHWPVVAFTALLVLAATALSAIGPAWRFGRRDPIGYLTARGAGASGHPARSRARRSLLVAQVAGSTFFLVAALFCVKSFTQALYFDPGFDTVRTSVLEIEPTSYGYSPEEAERIGREIATRLAATPGIQAAAVTNHVPFYVGFTDTRRVSVDGRDCRAADCPFAGTYAVDAAFFTAAAIPLRAGRLFDEARPEDRDAVVVNETAARVLWPGVNPIGRTFREGPDAHLRTIVGVVADITHRAFQETPAPYFYTPTDPTVFHGRFDVLVRASGPDPLVAPLRSVLTAVAPGVPPAEVQTMRERMALPLWMPKTLAGFFGACGALAVLLAAVGLFGVAYFAVSQRTREFGVRAAVGASRRDLRRLVLGESISLVLPGAALGLVAAAIGVALGRASLFGLSPLDPTVYATAAVAQGLVTLAASWWPAERAGRVDPLVVLRAE